VDQYKIISSYKEEIPSQELFEKIKNYINILIDETLTTSELWEAISIENNVVYSAIKEFLLGNGKRLRPILFYLTYVGYSEKPNWFNANKAMLAMELIHAFILIHDDIIDKSDYRRSKPTLHSSFNSVINELSAEDLPLISGEDMAIVAGDMLYAFAINTFHEVELKSDVYQKSLNILTKVAVQTAHGEFKELLETLKPIRDIKEEDLFKIYDLKTAHYSFCAPMSLGAVLAEKECDLVILEKIALLLGRAFQILNDVIELEEFGGHMENIPPKDFEEKKRTLILFWTYKYSDTTDRLRIEEFLKAGSSDILEYVKIYNIIIKGGAIDKARQLICALKRDAMDLFKYINMNDKSKDALKFYFNCLV